MIDARSWAEEPLDLDLVGAIANGDEYAFRVLFRRYGPIAKALALRIARRPFLAEEIVQEAFLSLWRSPGAYREDRGSVRAWLMGTVHHRAVDAIRREESLHRRSRQIEPLVHLQEDIADSVVERTDLDQALIRLRYAWRDVPPEQRLVIEMMYFRGMTQVVIASVLHLPLGTVKSRSLVGMRRLRSALSGPTEAATWPCRNAEDQPYLHEIQAPATGASSDPSQRMSKRSSAARTSPRSEKHLALSVAPRS